MNSLFTCIIVDDEQDAIDLLSARLQILFSNVEIVATYTIWEEALNALKTASVDIIFMDISMSGKNGMDLLRLTDDIRFEIIFVTAHEEYALRAFEFPTSGYILKPIDDLELKNSVNIALQRMMGKRPTETSQPVRIGIPDTKGISYIDMYDILYLEATSGYTKVVLDDRVILSSFNLGKFKTVLNSNVFYQVHRSFIINLHAVTRYNSTGEIVMRGGAEIPVSKTMRHEFLNLFNMVSNSSNQRNP